MGPFAVEPQEEAQVPLVADRHAVPAARLTDDEEVGSGVGEEMAGAPRIAFLTHGADDDDLPRAIVAVGRHERGCERPLRVTGTPSMEAIALESDGQPPLHRVDVSEEHDGGRALADPRNPVPGGVRVRREAEGPRNVDEPLDGPRFVARRAVFLDERRQDPDVIHSSGPSRARRSRETIARPGSRAAGAAGPRSILRRSRARPPLASLGGPAPTCREAR